MNFDDVEITFIDGEKEEVEVEIEVRNKKTTYIYAGYLSLKRTK